MHRRMPREHEVCLLRVAAGGFLGLEEAKFLIPMDAIRKVDDRTVQVDQTGGHVASGPRYNPDLINVRHLSDVYGHYGHSPWLGSWVHVSDVPLFPIIMPARPSGPPGDERL
jgi:hypothetical protein